MVFTLLKKEFNANKNIINRQNIWMNIFSLVISLILMALEITLFVGVTSRFVFYGDGAEAFFIIFVYGLTILELILCTRKISKSLYDKNDNIIMLVRPIRSSSIILSKLINIYIREVMSVFFIIYPIFISYGICSNLALSFYFISLLYIVLIPLFIIGVGLVLSIFYYYISSFLANHNFLQIILGIAFFIVICYFYGIVLNFVTSLVTSGDSNELINFFNTENINAMKNASVYLGPTNYMINAFLNIDLGQNILYSALILILSFIFGVLITSAFYLLIRRSSFSKTRYYSSNKVINSPINALIKKEINLFFRDTNYILNYIALLVAGPYLIYIIIIAINNLFTVGNMGVFASLLPGIVGIFDIFIIILFTGVINSSASTLISNEKMMIRINKVLPISYFKQVLAKLCVPFFMSTLSLLITCLVLYFSKAIDLESFLISFFISLFLILSNSIFSIYRDLKKPNFKDSINNNLVSGILRSLIFPFILFFINLIIIFIYYFNQIDSTYLFNLCVIIDSIIVFFIFVGSILHIKRKANTYYQKIEV